LFTYSLSPKKNGKIDEVKKSRNSLFCIQVIPTIDENLLEPLFSIGKGSSNALVRTLSDMMIFKKTKCLIDSPLFGSVGFNPLKKVRCLFNSNTSIEII
jgi:hypothetical protein